jgi:hypothetical protein
VNLENVSRDDRIVGGVAIVLAIGLLVFPWFDVSAGPFSATFSATSTPDGWLGILAFIAVLAFIADLAVERFSPQTTVPMVGGSRTQTRFILAGLVALFVVLKFLFHINFSGAVSFDWGFYLDVILTGGLVYFALQARGGSPMMSRPSSPSAPPPPPA